MWKHVQAEQGVGASDAAGLCESLCRQAADASYDTLRCTKSDCRPALPA